MLKVDDPGLVESSIDGLERSYAGQLGKFIQPVFEPLGFDWKLTVGVVTSFAAREVFVSTMTILSGHAEGEQSVLDGLSQMKRSDGTLLFDKATSVSLLVFYVLAIQCLPTLAVTKSESGNWRWAASQLLWMSALAWLGGWICFLLMGILF